MQRKDFNFFEYLRKFKNLFSFVIDSLDSPPGSWDSPVYSHPQSRNSPEYSSPGSLDSPVMSTPGSWESLPGDEYTGELLIENTSVSRDSPVINPQRSLYSLFFCHQGVKTPRCIRHRGVVWDTRELFYILSTWGHDDLKNLAHPRILIDSPVYSSPGSQLRVRIQ